TTLFITATAPPLDAPRREPVDLSPKGLPVPCRYVVTKREEPMDEAALAEALVASVSSHRAVGVILNTIEDAGRVYEQTLRRCDPEVAVISLHGAMTSLHKKAQIDEVRQRLTEDLPTIVVATQIIEAGVDLSF